MRSNYVKLSIALLFIAVGLTGLGFNPANWWLSLTAAQESSQKSAKPTAPATLAGLTDKSNAGRSDERANGDRLLGESNAAFDPDWERPYPQYQAVGAGKTLLPFPQLGPGELMPLELYRYGGAGASSFASVNDVADFNEFYQRLSEQKPKAIARWKEYLESRYNFTGATDPKVTMSRSKPLPVGPVTRLPKGVSSWEELANLSPREIYERELMPEGFRPLAHPLQSTGHMLFPQAWTNQHPESVRFDIDFDLPNQYLPEFPPPLFLTTRPDLGDVSKGREITLANFRELFDGIITPEQTEGLRLLVAKAPTSWFNQTKHRLTKEPSRGVACFDCHVNGHTNGAIAMDPATRPTLARARLDTPSMRGNNITALFSLRRSIRSTDHFAEVEEYFDGDISLQPQIGGRQLDRVSTNRMGDFNSIVAFPPAPKLNRLGRLEATKATASELRGEKLFFGKASCNQCHTGPYYTDGSMHDLRVEEFYRGRAEGWAKTFPLRGIKDSPPYMHDGRLPTLEDTVEFFNLIFQLKLTREEKFDLVAFLRCL